MALTVSLSYKEQEKKLDENGLLSSATVPYIVFEAADEDAALAAVYAEAPKVLSNLPLSSVEIDSRENDSTYKVIVSYESKNPASSGGEEEEEPEATLSFDCGGGSKHVTHSLQQTIVYGSINPGGAVGWNGKSGSEMEISGVDIPTAQLRETYTKIKKLSSITTSYKRSVAALVGKINADIFKGWNPGEVMFLGMSYSCPEKKSTKVTVSYNFAIQPNETDVNVGGVLVSKNGFDYAWAISSVSAAESGVPTAVTSGVFVDKVCEYANFSILGL